MIRGLPRSNKFDLAMTRFFWEAQQRHREERSDAAIHAVFMSYSDLTFCLQAA